jgi:uncharacterized protein YkwD
MPYRPALVLALLIAATGLTSTALTASANITPQSNPRISALEDRAFEAINLERTAHSLRALVRADDLSAVARAHSLDMIARHYFSHRSPEGADLRARFARGGINHWQRIAENIACNLGYSDPAATAVTDWMNSPSHRQNILDSRLIESGIGVAVDEIGRVYFTQVFATRDRETVARAK